MVLQGTSVLVIDDEPDTLLALMALLRVEGAEVDGVATGEDALTLCRKLRYHFDIIVSDFGLPDTRGDALVRAIRAVAGRTCIVIITGESEPFLTRARDAGADAVFAKPVEWSGVLSYLRSFDLSRAA